MFFVHTPRTKWRKERKRYKTVMTRVGAGPCLSKDRRGWYQQLLRRGVLCRQVRAAVCRIVTHL